MCSCMFQICLKAMPMSSSVIQTGERALMYKNIFKKKKVYLKLNWGSACVKQIQYCSSKLHRQRHINTEKFVLDSLVATPESINSDEVYLTLVEIF